MNELIPSSPPFSILPQFPLRDTTPSPSKRPLAPDCENEQKPLKQRITEAKDWLIDNQGEQQSTAARIYHIKPDTLRKSVRRTYSGKGRGGHTRILKDHQTRAIHDHIRTLLLNQIQPTMGLVFHTICQLKTIENSQSKPPSKSWFQRWWKTKKLNKIKTKQNKASSNHTYHCSTEVGCTEMVQGLLSYSKEA